MPYKDPKDPRKIAYYKTYYQKNKDKFWSYDARKESILKYKKKNRIVLNGDKRKRHNSEKEKERRKKYKARAAEQEKIHCENLTERYMIKHLKKMGYSKEDILSNPELIRTQRIIIKTKRLCRTSKN